jgi:hypothetical protein
MLEQVGATQGKLPVATGPSTDPVINRLEVRNDALATIVPNSFRFNPRVHTP